MFVSYDSYRVFYYVARYGSFTKAAQQLYSNQPNVTRTIKRLEQELGCALFVRTNRGVKLTEEGRTLYDHVAPAVEHLQAGEEALVRDGSLTGGVIRIAASEIALHLKLLPTLKAFRQSYPQVRLRIFNTTTRQAIAALGEGQADLALVTTPMEEHPGLLCRELHTFCEVPVCGDAYGDLAETQPTLAQLCAYPLISLGKGTMTQELYQDYFASHGLTLQPDIEAATADQILPMVRSDLGVGFVPEPVARRAAGEGGVHILRLKEALPRRAVCLLKRGEFPLSRAGRALEEMLMK